MASGANACFSSTCNVECRAVIRYLYLKDKTGKEIHGELADVLPDRVAQSVGHLTRKSGVLGSIPGLATYFRFSFRFLKKGSCQLLAKVCARSTG